MRDELSVLKLVTARLDAAGLAYMVTGSVALSLYAEPRMTRDVDLVVELQPADATRFAGTIDGAQLWVVSPEDLLLSKLDWARETQP